MIGKDDIQRQLQAGAALHRAGRLREAETIYRRVLSSRPRNADALYLLGLVTQLTRRFAESADLFQRAVSENPKSVKYQVNLGLSLGGMGLGRTAEAIEALRKAVALDPNVPEAWSNLGNEFRNDLKFDQAIECYQKALRLKPDFADAQCNLGVALQETEPTLAGAIAAYEKAIAMQGDFGLAHWNLGFALLLLGDYARGLAEYEWRFKTQSIVAPRNFPQPQWDGTDLAGQRILLHAEQGLGDTIHVSRYVPMVAGRGGKVILECPAPLIRLLGNLEGLTQIIAAGEPLPPFDVHCPLMTLPLVFKTTLATIPANVPYLQPDPQLVEPWAIRLPPDRRSPRIGLAWAGRPENKNDRNRSMRLDQFAPLSTIKHARFVTLQLGPAAIQARRPPAGMELIDHTSELHDFADTAAMLANLDLIITVDTAVAHLAGALARPAWVLLPYMPDWRWMLDRADSPWYPSLRLFRQKTRGDWAEVMERVKRELESRRVS
ncbi:MAG: tetratricopeptide repeat-containing glycosyltransferase family protein [Tepidisphaeraceae bacterium]